MIKAGRQIFCCSAQRYVSYEFVFGCRCRTVLYHSMRKSQRSAVYHQLAQIVQLEAKNDNRSESTGEGTYLRRLLTSTTSPPSAFKVMQPTSPRILLGAVGAASLIDDVGGFTTQPTTTSLISRRQHADARQSWAHGRRLFRGNALGFFAQSLSSLPGARDSKRG